ncbi:MAG TPA: hypothetical protein VFF13_06885 [archaeon]|nr:hypothetical protein [archaeon]
MLQVEGKLRKWGKSFGLAISKRKAEEEKLREGENVKALIMKDRNILRETFGTLKFKKSTRKMMKEIDAELDSEF